MVFLCAGISPSLAENLNIDEVDVVDIDLDLGASGKASRTGT